VEGMTREYIFTLIAMERNRQDNLVAAGELPFNCADPSVAFAEKSRVLGEEYGEVCESSYEADHSAGVKQLLELQELQKELVQLAAATVAWLESLGRVNAIHPPQMLEDPMRAAKKLLKDGELQRVPAYLVGQLKERLENFNRQKNEWKPLINANQR
jgi:hypothetical protein